MNNDHWLERLDQRGGYDIIDEKIKKAMLDMLKSELNRKGTNITYLNEQKTTVCVTTKDKKLHFILAKQKTNVRERNSDKNAVNWTTYTKEVFVPVTVLAPGMGF